MAQTLEDFLIEARESITAFEKQWRTKHVETPEMYPLEMSDGNEGLWQEFLHNSDE